MSDARDDAGRFQPPAAQPAGSDALTPPAAVGEAAVDSASTGSDTEMLRLAQTGPLELTEPYAPPATSASAQPAADLPAAAEPVLAQDTAAAPPPSGQQIGEPPAPAAGEGGPTPPSWSFEAPMPVPQGNFADQFDSNAAPAEPPQPPAPRRGPGWPGVIGVAATLTLVSALLGGGVGAYLANAGRLTLGSSNYTAPQPEPGSTARPAGSVASIAASALPSVVTLRVNSSSGAGTGSGWVFDSAGHIVTNNHVVEGAANSTVTIVLSDGQQVSARIVGADASYDLAVVKVSDATLKPLPIGDSNSVVVGDPVIAVGAPLGLESTVTTGIISALNRPVSVGGGAAQSFINALQTDAAINPGNSGGPLLNMAGEVIGVNSAIAQVPSASTASQSGSIGVGFSIPSDQVRRTAEQLIRTGKAEHPIIGVQLDRTYAGEGVKISADSGAVTADGPADKAGIQAGDVIVAFEGRPVTDPDELVVAIRAKSVGDTVTLKVRRDGKDFDAKMTLQGQSG